MSVIIVGYGDAPDFDLLADAVRERGGDPTLVDVTDWPGASPLRYDPGAHTAVLGERIDFREVSGAFVSSHALFRPYERRFGDQLDEALRPALNQIREHRSFFEGVLGSLEDWTDRVVPGLSDHYWHGRKPRQLAMYEEAGLPVPETLYTNDPDAARDFADRHDRVIYKPLTRGGAPAELEETDLTDENLRHLATAPVQFQEFVPGRDIRAYLLDGDIVGAITYDSESFSFKVDRKEGRDVSVRSATVTRAIEQLAAELTEVVDLTFGAADIILRPDGEPVVLEVNEAPRFAAADRRADQGIADALARYLLGTD